MSGLDTSLDTAQRLSLIQRHLEAAQLNIDSATELLGVILNGYGESEEHPPGRKTWPAAKKKAPRKKVGPTALIEEYIAAHPGEFGFGDLAKWAKGKGYTFNKGSVQQGLYVMANRKKGIVQVEKGSGRYKRAA
jgi:hypothetical protein